MRELTEYVCVCVCVCVCDMMVYFCAVVWCFLKRPHKIHSFARALSLSLPFSPFLSLSLSLSLRFSTNASAIKAHKALHLDIV